MKTVLETSRFLPPPFGESHKMWRPVKPSAPSDRGYASRAITIREAYRPLTACLIYPSAGGKK